jgi:uncharacterized MAPEG superfamily protein
MTAVWQTGSSYPEALHARLPIGARFQIVHLIDLMQWPAMAATVIAAWFVGSQNQNRRNWGFWLFLASNVLWIIWGWHDHAYALVALQIALGFINVRGAAKNRPARITTGKVPGICLTSQSVIAGDGVERFSIPKAESVRRRGNLRDF